MHVIKNEYLHENNQNLNKNGYGNNGGENGGFTGGIIKTDLGSPKTLKKLFLV